MTPVATLHIHPSDNVATAIAANAVGVAVVYSAESVFLVIESRARSLRNECLRRLTTAKLPTATQLMVAFRCEVLPETSREQIDRILPFILAGSVTTLTSLDFLGFGLPVGSPSLGELLLQGKNNLNAPWLAFTGFFIIALMLSLLVFIGEAVRDAFNPRRVPT